MGMDIQVAGNMNRPGQDCIFQVFFQKIIEGKDRRGRKDARRPFGMKDGTDTSGREVAEQFFRCHLEIPAVHLSTFRSFEEKDAPPFYIAGQHIQPEYRFVRLVSGRACCRKEA